MPKQPSDRKGLKIVAKIEKIRKLQILMVPRYPPRSARAPAATRMPQSTVMLPLVKVSCRPASTRSSTLAATTGSWKNSSIGTTKIQMLNHVFG